MMNLMQTPSIKSALSSPYFVFKLMM